MTDSRIHLVEESSFELPARFCPYLGSFADPDTARGFVTPDNCCQHVQPATAVKPEKQRHYCLTYRHVNCPIYRHDGQIILPAKQWRRLRPVRVVIPTVIACLIFILAVIVAAAW